MTDTKKIRALAEAARDINPGDKWTAVDFDGINVAHNNGLLVNDKPIETCVYISAMHPTQTLELLDELETATTKLVDVSSKLVASEEECRQLLGAISDCQGDCHDTVNYWCGNPRDAKRMV